MTKPGPHLSSTLYNPPLPWTGGTGDFGSWTGLPILSGFHFALSEISMLNYMIFKILGSMTCNPEKLYKWFSVLTGLTVTSPVSGEADAKAATTLSGHVPKLPMLNPMALFILSLVSSLAPVTTTHPSPGLPSIWDNLHWGPAPLFLWQGSPWPHLFLLLEYSPSRGIFHGFK